MFHYNNVVSIVYYVSVRGGGVSSYTKLLLLADLKVRDALPRELIFHNVESIFGTCINTIAVHLMITLV